MRTSMLLDRFSEPAAGRAGLGLNAKGASRCTAAQTLWPAVDGVTLNNRQQLQHSQRAVQRDSQDLPTSRATLVVALVRFRAGFRADNSPQACKPELPKCLGYNQRSPVEQGVAAFSCTIPIKVVVEFRAVVSTLVSTSNFKFWFDYRSVSFGDCSQKQSHVGPAKSRTAVFLSCKHSQSVLQCLIC